MAHKPLSPAACRAFRKKVYDHFRAHRRAFSWRATRDPYHVLVSEVMLQQTQTGRVETKFGEFVAAFPDFAALAAASLRDVLRVWQGMGYNRRALYLQKAAVEVMRRFRGELPASVEALESLPGIGPATARSVAAYAFGLPVVFIETNIRTVFIHEFFPGKKTVSDAAIEPLVAQTLDRNDPWKWYNALMDYGVMLKERFDNPGRRSSTYARPSPFKDSDRRIRGEILRRITRAGTLTGPMLCAQMPCPPERLERCLRGLLKDGLLEKRGRAYAIS
jgi:A/G-specific adenine glycosylase